MSLLREAGTPVDWVRDWIGGLVVWMIVSEFPGGLVA